MAETLPETQPAQEDHEDQGLEKGNIRGAASVGLAWQAHCIIVDTALGTARMHAFELVRVRRTPESVGA